MISEIKSESEQLKASGARVCPAIVSHYPERLSILFGRLLSVLGRRIFFLSRVGLPERPSFDLYFKLPKKVAFSPSYDTFRESFLNDIVIAF